MDIMGGFSLVIPLNIWREIKVGIHNHQSGGCARVSNRIWRARASAALVHYRRMKLDCRQPKATTTKTSTEKMKRKTI